MATFEASPDLESQIMDLVRPFVMEKADEIAGACESNITFPSGRSGPVETSETEKGATVGMMGPFGHIEEWGSIYSGPKAPLRRAVEASGLEFDEI